ncbi:MAG: chemotaxis-specific protein-glutamate methyltransferase CheB [Nanoarchaeota archaeon]
MINLLIVDDSALIRKIIKASLEDVEGINVVGYAVDGEDALKKISKLKPDIVTLDMNMPKVNGLEVLRETFDKKPIPFLIISSEPSKDSKETLLALEEGAVDFILKPKNITNKENLDYFKSILLDKIYLAIKSKPHVFHPIKKKVVHKFSSKIKKILIIGASTGGPSTISKLFSELPPNLSFPILIVQHMPEGFTKYFAQRLNLISQFDVKEAENDELISNNVAYICPSDYHMEIYLDENNLYKIKLQKGEKLNHVRPSIDVLSKSVAHLFKKNALLLILTGMGKDGTDGARSIKKHGGIVITQNKESSILFGMPKSIIDNNLADQIIDLSKMSVLVIKKLDG